MSADANKDSQGHHYYPKKDGFDESGRDTELQKKYTLKTRTRKKDTAPENPIWIMVSVIGSGKLKYLGDSTHCKNINMAIKGK